MKTIRFPDLPPNLTELIMEAILHMIAYNHRGLSEFSEPYLKECVETVCRTIIEEKKIWPLEDGQYVSPLDRNDHEGWVSAVQELRLHSLRAIILRYGRGIHIRWDSKKRKYVLVKNQLRTNKPRLYDMRPKDADLFSIFLYQLGKPE